MPAKPLLALFVLVQVVAPAASGAATVWNGPAVTFTKADGSDPTQAANQDRMTPEVWLTRGISQGLYNIQAETTFAHGVSPAGTEWASGTTANYAALTYTDWETWTKSLGGPPLTPGHNAVLHLKAEDIYIDIQFTSWSQRVGGGFAYTRSTPSVSNAPPSVTITNPLSGAVFTAPATVTLAATASDPDGNVTTVEYFDGGTSLGSAAHSPYQVTANLFPGGHTLTAVATDNQGASSTSAPVIITVSNTVIGNPIAARIPKGNLTIELQTIADGMAAPLGMAVPDDGSGRMFVYDQNGRVWIVTSSGRQATPLLDLSSRLVTLAAYDERGLLGLAAHPNFAQNPFIYTYSSEPYSGSADFPSGLGSTNDHQSVIAEWRISAANASVVDLASRREILRVDKPQFNHNSGAMHFGPDGLLYLTIGDGGQANDVGAGHVPGGNAQDTFRIWGKMLRIDIHGTNAANGQYGIPSDNPFVAGGGLAEIYAYGLRNPFSFSFDQATGQIYLGDVGQNKVEEVDIITKGGNYGWNLREGAFWFDAATGNDVVAPVRPAPAGLREPIAVYDHDDGLAIMGGCVYRGSAMPSLAGRYVFGDWGSFSAPSGRLFYLDETNGVNELRVGGEDRLFGLWLKGISQGQDGEIYLFASRWLGPSGNTGRMLKMVPAPTPITLTTPTAVSTNVTVSWDGGAGPFVVQRQTSLTDPIWTGAAIASQRSAAVPRDRESGFFRVVDAAHTPTIPLTVFMSGGAERPANNSSGQGFGVFVLQGNTLTFNVRYSGLSGVPIMGHLHGPAPASTNASVLIDLAPYNGGSWSTNGTLSGVILLTGAQKALILGNKTYLNIHTPSFPGGEIRGQLAVVNMQVGLSGANENPAVQSGAAGQGNLMLVGNQLTFDVSYHDLSGVATSSHIHGPATASQNAGVLTNLALFNGGAYGTAGSLSGTVTLSPDELAYVIDGLTYVNFHTPTHTSGEMRGQIVPQPTGVPLTALLSGLAEKPAPLTNSASGTASLSLEGNRLTFNITYAGLSGIATGFRIHGPTNSTGNAPIVVDLLPFSVGPASTYGAVSGSVNLSPSLRDAVLNGLAYVNFHTAAKPGGEMRGQIAPVAMTASLSGINERGFPAAAPVVTPGSGSGTFALVRDQLAMSVTYRDLLSTATASQLQGRAGFTSGGGVLVDLGPYADGAYGVAGSESGVVQLQTISTLLNVSDGQSYINFRTTNYPGGEIRGQLMR